MKEKIFTEYERQVAEIFRLTTEEMWEKSKRSEVVDARYLLYYLAHLRKISHKNIILYCAERGYKLDRNTLIYAIKVTQDKASSDQDYKDVINRIEQSTTI